MKTNASTLLAIAAFLALAVNLHSQGVVPLSTVDRLRDIKAKNAALVDKQTAELQKLDEIEKAAEQLRFFSKRS